MKEDFLLRLSTEGESSRIQLCRWHKQADRKQYVLSMFHIIIWKSDIKRREENYLMLDESSACNLKSTLNIWLAWRGSCVCISVWQQVQRYLLLVGKDGSGSAGRGTKGISHNLLKEDATPSSSLGHGCLAKLPNWSDRTDVYKNARNLNKCLIEEPVCFQRVTLVET